jgi:pantoate--beta-alanine ligase
MKIVRTVADVALLVSQTKIAGKKVSFVPTMGSIHEGHLSLVEIARSQADLVVASIFVNPLQFSSTADFELYPRSEDADAKALAKAGVDLLFLPSVDEIYPGGKFQITQSAGPIGKVYEGAVRPGHFDGMLTVVSRLFDIVQPDSAVFGAKDAQQLFLIRKMISTQNQSGTRDPIEIIEAPTIRDSKGLALSSRNKRLVKSQLPLALTLSQGLAEANLAAQRGGGPSSAYFSASSIFTLAPEAKLDYLALVNPTSFEPIEEGFTGQALMIVAATVGDVRLIDNGLITFQEKQKS